MATSQPTAEELKRLAEQQAKFNAELNRTEDLLEGIDEKFKNDISKDIKANIENARALNTQFAIGKDVSKQLAKTQLDNAIKLESLENERSRALAKLAKNGKIKNKEELEDAVTKLSYQIKLLQQTEATVRSIEQAVEAEKQATAEKRKQESIQEKLKKKVDDFYNSNLSTYAILASLLKMLVNGALQFNKTSVEIGKNFGYGTKEANRLTGELNSMAQSSTNVNVTLKSLTEAMNDLSTATGYVTEYSRDTLETQVMLTKQLGLTGDEAAGFYKYSVLTGKTSKETYNAIKNSFVAMRNQLGVGIPFKAVMAEVAKTSGAIAANLGFNPKRIAEAVTQAKALGTSLEQTKNQAESLLDFESSIEKELQAELITGQSLNLERARAFALTGDLAGVAEELANQGMTAAKFGEMNAIAQKDYAAALGLTSDQLSDQLQKRELAIQSGKSLAQLEAEQADEAAKRQTLQDKFNAAIEKLQALVGGLVAGPFGQLLDLLTKILDNTYLLSAAMGLYIGKLIFGIALKRAELQLSKKNAKSTIVEATAETSKSAAKVPFVGWALAITAGLATFAALSGLFDKGDDVISQGYGKRMLLDKGSITAFNDNDTIVAGTNLNKGGGGGGGGNNMEVVSAIRDMHNEMKQANSKPAVAVINGKDAFADSVGRSSALGTSQTINNSYKLA